MSKNPSPYRKFSEPEQTCDVICDIKKFQCGSKIQKSDPIHIMHGILNV